jgi:CRP-like cAMP-binding protein
VTKNSKIELLRSVPLFEGCSKRELGEIAALADEIDLPEGKTLITEGERGREFFALLDGSVEVRRKGRKVREMGPGEFFGEIALVADAPRTATVRTTAPSRALVVVDRDFRSLLERSPGTQSKVLTALARRLAPDAI